MKLDTEKIEIKVKQQQFMKKLASTMGDGHVMNHSTRNPNIRFKIDFSKFVKFEHQDPNQNNQKLGKEQHKEKDNSKIASLYLPSPKADVIRHTQSIVTASIDEVSQLKRDEDASQKTSQRRSQNQTQQQNYMRQSQFTNDTLPSPNGQSSKPRNFANFAKGSFSNLNMPTKSQVLVVDSQANLQDKNQKAPQSPISLQSPTSVKSQASSVNKQAKGGVLVSKESLIQNTASFKAMGSAKLGSTEAFQNPSYQSLKHINKQSTEDSRVKSKSNSHERSLKVLTQNRTEANNLNTSNANSNKNLAQCNNSQAVRKSSQADELGQSNGYRLISNVYGQKSLQSSAAPNSIESNRKTKQHDKESLTVFQRLTSGKRGSRNYLKSTDTQEEFRKVLSIINDAHPDQIVSLHSGCRKYHDHTHSTVPYKLDQAQELNPLKLRTIQAQMKYNDYLLRMGVIGSPTGQSTKHMGSTQTCEVGVQGDEILNLNIKGAQSAKNATAQSRYKGLGSSASRAFYSVAGRKISLPVPMVVESQ